MPPAADPAAELVKLGEAEALGVLDEHHARVRHVDPDLDHGRRHQHVHLAGREGGHGRVAQVGPLLAVDDADAQRPGASRAAARPPPRRSRPGAPPTP